MPHEDRVKALVEKARRFLLNAQYNLDSGFYDLAAFHAEQALQLYLKAVLLKITGFYPEVHRIRELLSYIYMHTGDDRIAEFTKQYRAELLDLENAYSEARYATTEYDELKARKLLETAKKCIKLVSKITNTQDITSNP